MNVNLSLVMTTKPTNNLKIQYRNDKQNVYTAECGNQNSSCQIDGREAAVRVYIFQQCLPSMNFWCFVYERMYFDLSG